VTESDQKVLAIVFGDLSASSMALAAAARGKRDLVWIVNSDEMGDTLMIRFLRKLGTVVDLAGLTVQQCVENVAATRPHGIVAYTDAHITIASVLAEPLDLDYYNHVVALRLTDKVAQRQAFSDAGLPVPLCAPLSTRSTPEEVSAIIDVVTFPVIIKPRHGAASRETHLAHDPTELRDLIDQIGAISDDLDMVVEEYMAGATPPPSSYFGDYVSVESVVAHGHISHLAVTGRLPSVPPFREVGLIIPCDYDESIVNQILGVATAAVRALGIRSGCLHTEIKVTDDGPRVIEVNGRIGGFVAPTLAQAVPGLDFYDISQRVALGETVAFDFPVRPDRVGYSIVGQPPQGARHVTTITGLDRVAARDGVASVSLNRQPGDPVDWRLGSHEYVYSVIGSAPNHDAVREMHRFIEGTIVVGYDAE